MSRSKHLIGLMEALSFRGHVKKDGIFYFFGKSSRFPNAIIDYDGGIWNVLILKKNDYIHPSGVWGTPWEDFDQIRQVAYERGLVKSQNIALTGPKFIELMATKNGINIAHLTKIFPELEKAEIDNKMKVGDFNLVYQNKKEGEQLGAILTEACKIASKHGFGKLCYGDVYSSPTLGRDRLADYTFGEDHIRMSNKAKKGKEPVRVFLHELGHRLWDKFLNEKQIKEVNDMYLDVVRGYNFRPSVGDLFINKEGKQIEIIDVKYSGRGKVKYIHKVAGTNGPKWESTKGYYEGLDVVLMHNKSSKHDFDVSAYGKQDAKEFLSEVFSYALTGKNKKLIDWIRKFK